MITAIDPAGYRRTPWKNGGGMTVDIAEEDGVWRFGRTPITAPGPFSDYTGFDRVQVLVAGRGLVLQTPDGEIDVRRKLMPVRFGGETKIESRLEAGQVEVVNLIARREAASIDLVVLQAGQTAKPGKGIHFAYCPAEAATVEVDGTRHDVKGDHCLRLDTDRPTMLAVKDGTILLGSVLCVSQ